jgi:hypothetical protein
VFLAKINSVVAHHSSCLVQASEMQWEEGIQIRTSIMGSNSMRKEKPIKMEIIKMIYDLYAHHLKTICLFGIVL